MYTGFNIGLPTTQVNWKVRVIDAAGTGVVTASPHGGTYASWNVIFYTTNHVGEASAEVYPGSFAVETNGSICYSGSPEDYTRIYD